ncbi:MAG: 3'(2'),5'-bisphosphate nucleotidase CysQ [Deltaproteobacteria bacterium]|nr:3'(2'),5'-bisphosphate nucleotidase CysQ [Deltaproteobacteria bacterium]
MDKTFFNTLVDIACNAGSAIMKVYSETDFEINTKTDESPVTLADMLSEAIIQQGLSAIDPLIPVLSEEAAEIPYETRQQWDRFWLVDPLDGTREFIKKNNEFTVNIALIEHGLPVAGIVHAPALGLTYFAGREYGAYKVSSIGARPLAIRVSDYRSDTLRIVASRSHKDEKISEFLRAIGEAQYISMGSSLKFCLVAEGQAHLYPRLGPTMEWDTAAAQCIVEEAGGTVVNLEGKRLSYNKSTLTNPFFVASGKPSFPWWEYIQI